MITYTWRHLRVTEYVNGAAKLEEWDADGWYEGGAWRYVMVSFEQADVLSAFRNRIAHPVAHAGD